MSLLTAGVAAAHGQVALRLVAQRVGQVEVDVGDVQHPSEEQIKSSTLIFPHLSGSPLGPSFLPAVSLSLSGMWMVQLLISSQAPQPGPTMAPHTSPAVMRGSLGREGTSNYVDLETKVNKVFAIMENATNC